jgi:hypothetical protein
LLTYLVVGRTVDLFEFDKRFDAFGKYFFFYDYKDPENVPDECVGAYQVVIADPPFLSEECLEKVALTVKKIVAPNGKILLCTGTHTLSLTVRNHNLTASL